MDLLRKAKIEELKSALQDRFNCLIVLYGPPGSLKTTVLNQLCTQLGLTIEYIIVDNYKNKLINKNGIALTDLDGHEFITKNKSKLEGMRNLVVETRSLQNVWKHFKNCKIVEFRKVCETTVKKLVGPQKEAYEVIDGNLHRLPFYKYCNRIESIDIYRYLGRLFYSKNLTGGIFNGFKITNYLFKNAINFFEDEILYTVYEGFSLCDYNLEEFYLYSEYLVYSNKKKSLGKYSFRGGQPEEGHKCTTICKQFRETQ